VCSYVQLLVAQKLDKGIRKQIASFCKGLWSFIPRALLSLFDEFELELLISGIPTIDVEDWRSNCKCVLLAPDQPSQVGLPHPVILTRPPGMVRGALSGTLGTRKIPRPWRCSGTSCPSLSNPTEHLFSSLALDHLGYVPIAVTMLR
jgi:hypothetical protein